MIPVLQIPAASVTGDNAAQCDEIYNKLYLAYPAYKLRYVCPEKVNWYERDNNRK